LNPAAEIAHAASAKIAGLPRQPHQTTRRETA
jgi:hypothetical protein